jgi:hypothetical protein
MKHASPNILNDLDKMHPDHAAEIRRVAGSDTTSTTILGANRPVQVRDWARKIGAHHSDPLPAREMPAYGGKPKADWPKPAHGPFASGVARSGAIGSMPSFSLDDGARQ